MPDIERDKFKVANIDFLWKIISRFDFYFGTTNMKATVIVAFNTFIFSAIVLKIDELLLPLKPHKSAVIITAILLVIAALASLVSLGAVFLVINPFLKSPKHDLTYQSKIFFQHIAEYKEPKDYLQFINKCTDDNWIEDLSMQAYALSKGLKYKFDKMKTAIGAILFVQLPALGLIVLIRIITQAM